MPVTFPSHAAAVLPLTRAGGRLPPSALVVGTCAPDFAYLLDTGKLNFHAWPGVLWPGFPCAVGVWLLFEALVLPSLARVLPAWRGVSWADLATTRGLPRSARGWVAALVGLWVGIATHLAWDGLTHFRRWPASVLYADVVVRVGVVAIALPHLLQWLSSLVGAWWVARAVRRLAPAAGGRPATRPGVRRVGALVCAGVGLAWLVLGWRWGLARLTSPLEGAWLWFWYGARGGLLGLVVACALETLEPRARRTEQAEGAGSATWE